MSNLLLNVHEAAISSSKPENTFTVSGKYDYYHYLCDGFDDRGWGCGYRTLQMICSWMNHNHKDLQKVPSIREIQEMLVQMEDKSSSFIGSKQWIGSFEVCLVIDKLYDVPCKILHVNKGDELQTLMDGLRSHFVDFGSPVMMGGDIDCSSKGVMGVHFAETNEDFSLLIVDPHYVADKANVDLTKEVHAKEYLMRKGWIKWQKLSEFLPSSFYNLCLPQVKAKATSSRT